MNLPPRVGRYEVEVLLGQGGMGRVLLARDPMLGRQVAIKVLRDDLGLAPDLEAQLVERLRQGARAAAALSHPAVVTLHDMGEDERVGLFLVFELVRGPTLRERLARGPLGANEVAQIARTIGAALTHAHAAGIVHGDIKPENIMLSPAGPKLADLGVAHLPGSTPAQATTVATTAYSAPEALSSGEVGASGDQFSLAATLFEALTGSRALPGGDGVAVAGRAATRRHAAATTLLPALRRFAHLDTIFDRALAKEARKRFPSCEAFGTVLAAELERMHPTLVTPVSRSSIVPRATRRWQNVLAAIAVLVIITLIVLGRQQRAEIDGVSLKAAASAFASAIATTHTPPSGSHRARPPAAPSSSATAGGPGAALAPSDPTSSPAAPGTPSSLGGPSSSPPP